MKTYSIVPEGLEKDLASGHELVLRWEDKDGQTKEVKSTPMDSRGRVRIVLRPFVEVEETNPGSCWEGEPEIVTTTIPLESLVAIDVDDLEFRHGFGTLDDEASEDVVVPVSRWVRHPDKGLLRFTA